MIRAAPQEPSVEPTTPPPSPVIQPVTGLVFTATRNGETAANFNFDGVISDSHDSYSPSTFTCPVTGIYEFSLSVTSDNAAASGAVLTAAGSVVEVLADSALIAKAQASVSTIVRCARGETAAVRSLDGAAWSGSNWNSFTGELLFTNMSETSDKL